MSAIEAERGSKRRAACAGFDHAHSPGSFSLCLDDTIWTMSVHGTNRTSRAGPLMSVVRGRPEVAG
jgi:hypothetical protein